MKYLFAGKSFGLMRRGGYVTTKRFCNLYPEKTEFINACKINTKEQLQNYKKIIFRTQVPSAYNIPINGIHLRDVNHLAYMRNEYITPLLNTCTNGFHYYRTFAKIKNYIPFITPFQVEKKESNLPCLGFYKRNFVTKDSFHWVMEMLKNLSVDVDVYLMGEHSAIKLEGLSPHVKSVTHTYDNREFFKNVTHYIYPRSKTWVDPFPHSMLEAIQTGCQIISPLIKGRDHLDGVNDVLDCIKFHESFNPNVYFDNSKSIILNNFTPFYERVFENDFEYSFDRSQYKTFREWIEREVI